jgi:tripartite-type tricarboxylate transporter receptor subunit TctC
VSEFVDFIWSQGAQLPYSTSGIGSVTHLAMELFLNRTSLKMTNVNYKGAAQALAAVIAGEVPAMFSVVSESLPHVAAQTIRLLAVSSEERIPQAPDVPTLIELGFSGFMVKSWNGLMAPRGTPQTVVDKVANEVVLAMKDPEFVARLKAFGAEPLGNTPEDFKVMISKDIALWEKALKAARVSIH